MAAALAQRLQRIERALASLPPCPACAGETRVYVVGRSEQPEGETCDVCGRELDAVLFLNPYDEESPT